MKTLIKQLVPSVLVLTIVLGLLISLAEPYVAKSLACQQHDDLVQFLVCLTK